jgi:hypothetical protein
MLSCIFCTKDVSLHNILKRIHLYESDGWMVAVSENIVISIELMKRPENKTYMFHPRSSLLEVTY